MYQKKKGLSVRVLVTTGIFSALYIVFMCIGALFFAPNPMLTFLTPLGIALLTGPVYLLFVSMTARYGAITIFGAITGLLIIATGMFWLWALACLVFGFLADLLAGIGGYRNKPLNILSFLVYSLSPFGSYVMLVVNQDAYVRYLVGKGTDPAYMETMLSTFRAWMIPAMLAGTLLCGTLSALLGWYLLKKQFEKAGVAS